MMRQRTCFHFVLVTIFLLATPAAAQQSTPDNGNAPPETAAVVIDGKPLFRVRGITSYPAAVRAHTVRQRIIDIARDRSVPTDSLHLEQQGEVTLIKAGDRLVIGLVDVDAEYEGVSLNILATSYLERIAKAIAEYRSDRSTDRLLRNGAFALGATVVLAIALWGLVRLFRVLNNWSERRVQKSIEDLANKSYNLFHAGTVWRLLAGALVVLRLALIITLIYFYLNAVLGLFPWTRPLAVTLFNLVLTPLKSIGLGFVSALPNLFFLAVLVLVVRFVLKIVRAFFSGIDSGRIRFENFDRDWAIPTYKILRVFVIAFSIVVAYPYIPGSDSMAFKGVSVLLGVLLSLGSSSFIANTIAGLTMTYRGAFKEGDLVRVGDVMGRVEDIKLMVTRVRTAKNEMVILPNSNILNTDVVNYSSLTRRDGLMLHTTVGIGYDTPWRQVEALLLQAAGRTEGLLTDPPPFVLHKALGDFAVDYELNALCKDDRQIPRLYSRLHANIQDVFNEHDVQIMSPHYVSDTETPKTVSKERWFTAPAEDPGA